MICKLVEYFVLLLLATSFVCGEDTAGNSTIDCDEEVSTGTTWKKFCEQQGLMCLYESSKASNPQCVCHTHPNCEQLCPDLANDQGVESKDKCINAAKDDTCTVICKKGFKLKDGKMGVKITCLDGGKWNRDPTCYQSCPAMKNELGMNVTGDCELAFDKSKCTVSCDIGYYLADGPDRVSTNSVTTICGSKGKWDKQLQCLAVLSYSSAATDYRIAQDCAEHFKSGERISGVYSIRPLGYNTPFYVFCDMTTAGGGWTVFQRRGDFGNSEYFFFKRWNEYKNGFGDLSKEFWLGNDHIAALTQQGGNVLRVDLTTMNGDRRYAQFNRFWVDKENQDYRLAISGYSGNAGDALSFHNNMKFSTIDRGDYRNIAESYKGGWWYDNGHNSNLNGLNLKGDTKRFAEGIIWYQFRQHHYSLYSEMKIRPTTF